MTTQKNEDNEITVVSLGLSEKVVAVCIALGTIIFSAGSTYMMVTEIDHRVTKLEMEEETNRSAITDVILKTDVRETKMSAQLDEMISHLERLDKWADMGFDQRKNAGSIDAVKKGE